MSLCTTLSTLYIKCHRDAGCLLFTAQISLFHNEVSLINIHIEYHLPVRATKLEHIEVTNVYIGVEQNKSLIFYLLL